MSNHTLSVRLATAMTEAEAALVVKTAKGRDQSTQGFIREVMIKTLAKLDPKGMAKALPAKPTAKRSTKKSGAAKVNANRKPATKK